MSHGAESGYRITSISRRFSYLLIGIVTILLMVFSAIVVSYHIRVIEEDLNTRLENAIRFAQKSLPKPLWNLDFDVVNDVIDALFLNESVVYATIFLDDRIIIEKSRLEDQAQKNTRPDLGGAGNDKSLIAREAGIFYEDNKVGTILIQMTRKRHQRQLMHQIYGITALTVVIISAIWITTLLMTRRYITNPLKRLQDSASKIAVGDLDAFVDKSGDDEIGMLACHLDRMRSAIKKLFQELRENKDKLEEYSRTLEKKVENRTRELERSVAELKALSEVSQSVSSTLELEKVLNNIVQHAVKLSKTDAGTIYEYHEAEKIFVPMINFGVDETFVTTMTEAKFGIGNGTILGMAGEKRSVIQVPDLTDIRNDLVEYVRKAGFMSVLAVPLLRKDRLVGSLVVRRKRRGEFPRETVELIQTFAAQSAIALHNARLFQELEIKSEELRKADKHKSEFLASMSHELRTPLNAILGYTELILDDIYGEVPAKIREVIERLEKNGSHLLRLINDVLDISKIEAGQIELALEEYSFQETIHTVVTSLEPLASEKELDLKTRIAPHLPNGKGDQRRIAQVLVNLIGNAIKFTEQGGILVDIATADGRFLVKVSDTGPGLSDLEKDYIFSEFYQVDGKNTRSKGGSGLGLSIAKRIVELHGGAIWVESVPGKGSTFIFTLPIRVEKQEKPE
jgi:signal transduction histidine kinase/methyl-accepting chemotaxis protein